MKLFVAALLALAGVVPLVFWIARAVLAEAGFDPNVVTLVAHEAGGGENTYLLKDNFCDERSNQSAPSEAADSAAVSSGPAVPYLIYQVRSIYLNYCSKRLY